MMATKAVQWSIGGGGKGRGEGGRYDSGRSWKKLYVHASKFSGFKKNKIIWESERTAA